MTFLNCYKQKQNPINIFHARARQEKSVLKEKMKSRRSEEVPLGQEQLSLSQGLSQSPDCFSLHVFDALLGSRGSIGSWMGHGEQDRPQLSQHLQLLVVPGSGH